MSLEKEISNGQRFEFGANWQRFLELLDEGRIQRAEESLRTMLGIRSLAGKSFIDVGSGSGLFSLAARRLGARVHSLDFDPRSVACTTELRRRYFADDAQWRVEEGSALDADYLAKLGQYDVVYSWGVLHHTGAMWQGLGNVAPLVAPGGRLFVAIYNDQGWASRAWLVVKRAYNRLPHSLRWLVWLPVMARLWLPSTIKDVVRLRPFATWRRYRSEDARGMNPWRDTLDWIGGLPFEVARPEQILDFYRPRGFELIALRTCGGGLGCNEFVFERVDGGQV